jgi:uncharacterized membrane protein
LRDNVGPQALVLAGTETSLFIPVWAGARVIAGHPDHTVRAAEKEAVLAQFYAATTTGAEQRAIVAHYGAAFVWYGPRERAAGAPPSLAPDWRPVFAQGDVEIYAQVSAANAQNP